MKMIKAIAAVVFAVVLAGYACCETMAQQKAGSDRFSNVKGRFSVIIPGTPQQKTAKIGEDADDIQHQFLLGVSNGVYMVAYQDHRSLDSTDAAVADVVYEAGRDGFQKAIGGKQTVFKEVSQFQLKGREMHFRIPAKQGEALSRMFFVNSRWYHVFVMGTPEFVNSKPAQTFLDSFKVFGNVSPQGLSREEAIQKLKDF